MVMEPVGTIRKDIVLAVAKMPKDDVALYFNMCWACLDHGEYTTANDYSSLSDYTCAVMKENLDPN